MSVSDEGVHVPGIGIQDDPPRGPSTWWHRRALRRIAAQGGHITGTKEPLYAPFEPTPVDAAAETTWVVELASALVPAVDEALAKPLDNVINARADQWIAQVLSEFERYLAKMKYALGRAEANVTQETQLQPPDTHRVVETETARNSAAIRLRGDQEKSAWAEPGHADPTLLAGRSRSGYLYVAALVVAASADIVAFYQVVQLVAGNLTSRQVLILVVGFTAIALILAHYIGWMLRDRKAGAKWIQLFMIILVAVVWIGLGGLAFWVRLKSNSGGSSGFQLPGTSSSSSAQPNGQGTLPGAAMFAGLYAGSGAVAFIGGYLRSNPLSAAFMRAVRAHRRAAEARALSARRLRLAEAEAEFFANQITAAERVRDEAIQARHALAAELKQRARVEFAKRLRDASATDAFFDEDARPYTYRPFPN